MAHMAQVTDNNGGAKTKRSTDHSDLSDHYDDQHILGKAGNHGWTKEEYCGKPKVTSCRSY